MLQVINGWKYQSSKAKKDDSSYSDNTNNHKKLLMPQSYSGYLTKLGEKHWLQQTRSQNATGKNGSILSYFFKFSPQGREYTVFTAMHVSVFLIRPTPTHNNTLQVIRYQFFDLQTLTMLILWISCPLKNHVLRTCTA